MQYRNMQFQFKAVFY